ncbi:TonB-dependent receptor [Gaoshiqia sp. Z1-71]|uniref:TonB-dependent receptor n=1 Tax=Gaoshiqia hydrogeniformans TaxID=3290090 RepID=UPI003BF9008C
MMKLTTFFFFLSTFALIASGSYSQNKTFTMSRENVQIKDVLREIEDQSGYFFIYNNEFVDVYQRINLQVKEQTIDKLLDQIFNGQHVKYSIDERKIILSSSSSVLSSQQNRPVTGKVTDASGMPLPGVTVVVKGTTIGAITDSEGNFSLSNAAPSGVLVFSFVGMKSLEIPVGSQTAVTVSLSEETVGIEEVVAIGYGTMKKSDLTGSVTSLRTENLNKGVKASLNQLLSGRAAGVRIIQNSNEPGGGITVNIRGAGSITAGSQPLYVVDGLPIDNTAPITASGRNYVSSNTVRSPLNSINPADIESIEILKDASATAIYGSRGANGVVMITTKKGSSKGMKVNYAGEYGLQSVVKKLRVFTADEYMSVLNEIIDAGGGTAAERVTEIQDGGTDWQDEIYRANAQIQNHNLALSGGNNKSSYFVGLNYFDQQGVVKTSSLKRYTARVNMTSEISEKFNFGLNMSTSYIQDDFAAEGNGFNENSGAIYAAFNFDPTLSIWNATTGRYQTSPFITTDNPLAILYGKRAASTGYRTYGTVFGNYNLMPGLIAKLNIGGDIQNQQRDVYVDRSTVDGLAAGGSASILNGAVSNYLTEGTLTYNKKIKDHSLTVMAGSTFQRFVTVRNTIQSAGFPSDATGSDNVDSGTQSTYLVFSEKVSNALLSYLGRINYSYKDKYLLTGSFRVDGSSRFGENNRYGYFPSFAGAWRINQENFMSGLPTINNLKMRLSWGRTGNQAIGDYQSIMTYGTGRLGVFNGQLSSTQEPTRLANPNLKWETTEQSDLGFDIGVFDDRISFSADYYIKTTFDMLLNKPVSYTSGFTSQLTNIGEIQNQGFELTLNTKNINKAFKWNTSLNLATLKNKVKDLGGQDDIFVGASGVLGANPAIIREGEPLYSFYGYKVIGVWQTDDDFSTTTDAVHPGDLKYLDVNGDKTVNSDDRMILGNSFPKLTIGMGNNFEFKRFSLDIMIEGVSGLKMFNNNLVDTYFPINFRRNKFAEPMLNRWTPENPSNKYPSFVTPLSQGQKIVNSYTVQDASYVRLQSVTFSYKLPSVRGFINSGSIFVTGQNLLTITKYDGMDPAANPNGNANYRVDFNTYPLAATVMLGVNIDF